MNRIIPYDHDYWDNLTLEQWVVFLEAQSEHRFWHENANMIGGELHIDSWIADFPEEMTDMAEEKLHEISSRLVHIGKFLPNAEAFFDLTDTDIPNGLEGTEAWLKAGVLWESLKGEKQGLLRQKRNFERILLKTKPISPEDSFLLEDFSEKISLAKQVPITELIGKPVKCAGRNLVTNCPFHGENTPSFTIYPDNHYYCFSCSRHGDPIDYVMQRDELDFKAAVNYLVGGS